MGNRGNIVIAGDAVTDPKVYLYTHWHGRDLPGILQSALKRRQRWDDQPYLTGIIFCEMVNGHESSEPGVGISTSLCGSNHDVLFVDVARQTVSRIDEALDRVIKQWSFSEFAELSVDDEFSDF